MKLLELFCGTKSVGRAIEDKFEEIVSVDIDSKRKPTITTDILTWDYTIYPPHTFQVIWASPPCQEYSILNHALPNKIPNLVWADRVVKKTIEIIEYFKPDKFFIENPQSGSLKDRDFMLGIPFYDFDYCEFSDWGYRKRTRIWTNVEGRDILCRGIGKCPNMIGKKHKKAIGNSSYKCISTLSKRYAIPANLIEYLFHCDV